MVGAFLSVAAVNFQRSRSVGRSTGHDVPVGEAQDVIEVLAGVLGIAPGVGPAEYGHGALLPEQIAQRVGELGRLREGTDEQHVQVGRQLLEQILQACIADKGHIVTLLLAPHADHLRHDAGQIGIHEAPVQRRVGALCDQVQNAYTEPAHAFSSRGKGALRRITGGGWRPEHGGVVSEHARPAAEGIRSRNLLG
jgi:hypothetical protein